jgi:hypothetical protein
VKVVYRGGSFTRAAEPIVKRAQRNLVDSARHLAQEVRNNLQTPFPPRSTPGNYPHMETTTLLSSYDFTPAVTQVGVFGIWQVTVGSDVEYAPYLEQGAPGINLLPRPHLVRTLTAQMNPMARIMAR